MAPSGILFLNDRDVLTDFSLRVASFSGGWPGMLGSAPRELPLSEGPEMQGAMLDPRLIRRKAGAASVTGYIRTASPALALATLDALKGMVGLGQVDVRTAYATDRYCVAGCEVFDGEADVPGIINGDVAVTLRFTMKDGVALRLQPDGYNLTTGRTYCPIGTAESYPLITIHGGGASLTNPVITIRNAAGDVVQNMNFTVVLGATETLLVDCARGLYVSKFTGSFTPADAKGTWTSGDVLVLRPYDGFIEAAAYPSVELSASAGTPLGRISYTRRWT